MDDLLQTDPPSKGPANGATGELRSPTIIHGAPNFFAWTIDPPLTAAFLGAGYWSSAVLELGSARRREWSRARLAMPAVLFFTTITCALTLVHVDRFHLDSVFGVAWLVVYGGFPVAMAMILFFQLRAFGADAPPRGSLPGWLRLALVGQATVMFALGAGLYAAPLDAAAIWPWPLTSLTGRAVGAWLLGTGFLAAHVAIENARERVDVAMLSYAAFGAMQLVAVARYSSTPHWNALGAAAYLGFLAAMVGLGLYGWFIGRCSPRDRRPEQHRRERQLVARNGLELITMPPPIFADDTPREASTSHRRAAGRRRPSGR